jgi:hypothetical protein
MSLLCSYNVPVELLHSGKNAKDIFIFIVYIMMWCISMMVNNNCNKLGIEMNKVLTQSTPAPLA